ncbi:hypothetical protein [Fodinicola feengrottensis]|uniref:hypothetical protein n=1 Tax=Fodinicola feengrottensis TaxID=435914 RepID=UPI0013D43643|nr:hypothetical protein [Fodinicola feengrottensis]
MADNFIGLTQANALGQGGQHLGSQAQSIQQQLNALIDDMSKEGRDSGQWVGGVPEREERVGGSFW